MSVKRLFDFIVAIAALPVALPLILVCAIAIRLDSRGAALFRQVRVGQHKRVFTLVKLRTMTIGTEWRASHEISESTVTGVGAFLRKWKLDELPQLWNVIRGEMSFVGPRPCLAAQAELVAARDRLGVYQLKPGITGISQLAGLDMSRPLELAESDARYLQNQSITGDLRMILQTAIGKGSGDALHSK